MKRLALLGLAFVLALAVPTLPACQQSHESPNISSQPDYGDGYHDGYYKGFDHGETLGHREGFDQGYDEGHAEYEDGYDTGWREGKAEGEHLGWEEGYAQGHDEGSEQGHAAGYSDGWDNGFAEGYEKGCRTCSESPLPSDPTDYLYVGSINSNVYHYPSCRYVAQIYPQNRIWFTSAEDARSQGYRPCKVCKPPG